jgi:hypothetical protein
MLLACGLDLLIIPDTVSSQVELESLMENTSFTQIRIEILQIVSIILLDDIMHYRGICIISWTTSTPSISYYWANVYFKTNFNH